MLLQEKYIYLHNKDITRSYFSFNNNSSPETALPFILGKKFDHDIWLTKATNGNILTLRVTFKVWSKILYQKPLWLVIEKSKIEISLAFGMLLNSIVYKVLW